MFFELSPAQLDWDEVDPARHPFDSTAAAQVVRSLGPARCVPRRPDVHPADRVMSEWSWNQGRQWTDAMTHALVERYGRWVVGWRYAHDEGEIGGGPVGAWCCPRDSISSPEETLDRVAAALCEWRGWLEWLAGRFEAYPLDLAQVADQRILWENAARNLIVQVADRTGCGSGWHGHCRQVLTWFLQRWGVAPALAQQLVDEAVGGRFKSWSGPDVTLVNDIGERLAGSLRPNDAVRTDAVRAAEPMPDHLERWLELRRRVPWHEAPDDGAQRPAAPLRDGAAEDIRTFDHAIDPERARGLRTALDSVRADAERGATLDFERLRTWQQHVLGAERPPSFRVQPAFAKGGRERYGLRPDTREQLDACLAESAPDGECPLPVAARAARAYLDVCFFHPFEDGNARAAFLALLFVLAREGLSPNRVSLLRRVAFQADAPDDPMVLARYVDLHLRDT